jgi:hypothetical protein
MEAGMRLRGDWLAASAAAISILGLAGCASAPPAAAPAVRTAATQPAKSDGAASPEAQSLAAQSQRDVDAILNARRENPASAADNENASAATAAKPPRKSVVWNDPGRSNSKTKPDSSAQPPLGRAAPEALDLTHEQPGGATTRPNIEPQRLKQLMVDLTRELNANAAYSEVPLKQIMVIAAMSMVDPDRKLNPEAFHDLSEKERELLSKLQDFFAELGKSLDSKSDSEQTIVEAVTKLRQSLVKAPQLSLPHVALCTRVAGFGDYQMFERNSFLAGSEQKVIVYLELEGFSSELNQRNEYVTELAQQIKIYSDRDGIPVAGGDDWQSVVDTTKNKRKDFFTVQIVTLPKALSVGKYQLKVRVRDDKSQAESEATIPFEMVADPKLAAPVPGK